MSLSAELLTVTQACDLAVRFGPVPGWTDTARYIREHNTFVLTGRTFTKRKDGKVECVD